MGVGGSIISFVMVWWLVLFGVLPLRPRSVADEPEKHAKGADRGAPVDPALARKIKLTTMIAIPMWLVVFLFVTISRRIAEA